VTKIVNLLLKWIRNILDTGWPEEPGVPGCAAYENDDELN